MKYLKDFFSPQWTLTICFDILSRDCFFFFLHFLNNIWSLKCYSIIFFCTFLISILFFSFFWKSISTNFSKYTIQKSQTKTKLSTILQRFGNRIQRNPYFYLLTATGSTFNDAVHITAIVGESVVFNCQVEFPAEHPVPYVLQWEKKVSTNIVDSYGYEELKKIQKLESTGHLLSGLKITTSKCLLVVLAYKTNSF